MVEFGVCLRITCELVVHDKGGGAGDALPAIFVATERLARAPVRIVVSVDPVGRLSESKR